MSGYYKALKLTADASDLQRRQTFELHARTIGLGLVVAIALATLVSGPWLVPGYLFGTDWPGPRRFDFPNQASSSFILQAALALTARITGGEATTKIFIFWLLLSAALFAYLALPDRSPVGGISSATVYVLNPFVYGRLEYGQLYLLAGYALLPVVAIAARRLFAKPTFGRATALGCALTAVGIPSLHFFFLACALLAFIASGIAVLTRKGRTYATSLLVGYGSALGIATVASLYWIVPLVTGRGPEGSRLAAIGSGDLAAFKTVPDARLGLVPNLLGLFGFWAEDTGRFVSMKVFDPNWPLVLAVMLSIAVGGFVLAWHDRNWVLAGYTASLLFVVGVAIPLEMGVSSPVSSSIAIWLDQTVPFYRGMRDAGKWAGPIALAYAQLYATGALLIEANVRRASIFRPVANGLLPFVTAVLLAVPLYFGNGLLYGAHGTIEPSSYPSGWYRADRLLTSDPNPELTLFLPWHEYMAYEFIRNQDNVVVSPAPQFFSVPILASEDPEVAGVPPPSAPEQVAISRLVAEGADGTWSPVLTTYHVKYVLLARDLDWKTYDYLMNQQGLVLIADYGSIVVFRNEAVG